MICISHVSSSQSMWYHVKIERVVRRFDNDNLGTGVQVYRPVTPLLALLNFNTSTDKCLHELQNCGWHKSSIVRLRLVYVCKRSPCPGKLVFFSKPLCIEIPLLKVVTRFSTIFMGFDTFEKNILYIQINLFNNKSQHTKCRIRTELF